MKRMIPPSRALASVAALVVLAAAACRDSTTEPADPGPPARVELLSGNDQVGIAWDTLAEPFVVRVLDARGRPVPGARVSWRMFAECRHAVTMLAERPEAGDPYAQEVVYATADSAGVARARWVLSRLAGMCYGGVGLDGGGVDSLRALVRPDSLHPQPIERFRGQGQGALAGTTLGDSIAIRVEDPYHNGLAGQRVTWRVTEGAGTVSSATTVTNGAGYAAVAWTLGASGPQRLEVSVAHAEPVTFTAYVAVPLRDVRKIFASQLDEACALAADSATYCWRAEEAAVRVADAPRFADVAVVNTGSSTAGLCGIDGGGRVHCRVGTGAFTAVHDSLRFAQIVAPTRRFAGGWCGRLTSGELRCFGSQNEPQSFTSAVRYDTISMAPSGRVCGLSAGVAYCGGEPVPGGVALVQVSSGVAEPYVQRYPYACGLDAGGVAYCWGRNSYVQHGNPTVDYYNLLGAGISAVSSDVPVPVSGGYRFRSVVAGTDGACGLTTDGALVCWGANSLSGDGGAPRRVDPELTFVRQLTTRCAIATDGLAYCGRQIVTPQ